MDEGARAAGARRPKAKRGRLSRSAEFERVYRQGRSHGSRFLVLHVFPRGAQGDAPPELDAGPRLGLSVSRKVGGSVDRNLVKRLLREAFAVEGKRLPAGQDVVVVARPPVLELAERDGLAGVQAELAALVTKVAGAVSSPAPREPEA